MIHLNNRLSWTAAAVLVIGCMLWLIVPTFAQPQGGQPPFSNAVEQRNEMIRELREIRELMKEQNDLLRTLVEKAKTATNNRARRDRE